MHSASFPVRLYLHKKRAVVDYLTPCEFLLELYFEECMTTDTK